MINRITSAIKHHLRRLNANALLGFREFAIVSNNCWGPHVHQYASRPYNTPFVGFFRSPSRYLALLRGWPSTKHAEMRFRECSKEVYVEDLRRARSQPWPVGYLADDIEVQFMHYETEEDAYATWGRRLARMPKDASRIFFEFDDRDGASEEQLQEFEALSFPNKVMFVAPAHQGPERIVIPVDDVCFPDGLELSLRSPEFFDTSAWITGRKSKLPKRYSGI